VVKGLDDLLNAIGGGEVGQVGTSLTADRPGEQGEAGALRALFAGEVDRLPAIALRNEQLALPASRRSPGAEGPR
jgi:hypothetical protein